MSHSDQGDFQVHIIGGEGMGNELLSYFLSHLSKPAVACTLEKSQAIAQQNRSRILALWDCQALDKQSLCEILQESVRDASARWYLACINVKPADELEKEAIARGVRGIFYENDTLETFKNGIQAIINGELWYSRQLLSESVAGFVDNKKPSPVQPPFLTPLTNREKEILRLVALGTSNHEIAEQLCISPYTVKTHVHNIYSKIDVPNRVQAIFWAIKNQLMLAE